MKKFLISIAIFAVSTLTLSGQAPLGEGEEVEHAGVEAEIDSTLYGKDIFSSLPDNVTVIQSADVRSALDSRVQINSDKRYSGYRIRLYFGSSRNSREESAMAVSKFNSMYPDVQVYRSYESPNFKVSVGNFRTRVDAELVLRDLKDDFPDAFIVREVFKYPSVGNPVLVPAEPSETE